MNLAFNWCKMLIAVNKTKAIGGWSLYFSSFKRNKINSAFGSVCYWFARLVGLLIAGNVFGWWFFMAIRLRCSCDDGNFSMHYQNDVNFISVVFTHKRMDILWLRQSQVHFRWIGEYVNQIYSFLMKMKRKEVVGSLFTFRLLYAADLTFGLELFI